MVSFLFQPYYLGKKESAGAGLYNKEKNKLHANMTISQ